MKLAIGIPVVYGIPGEAWSYIAAAIARAAKDFPSFYITGSLDQFPYEVARNQIVKACLDSGVTHLLFLDSDMLPPVDIASKLYSVMEATKSQVTTGFTYRRGGEYRSVWYSQYEGKSVEMYILDPETPPVEIRACGMACTLLDLEWAKENLEQPFFVFDRTPGNELGEDINYCRQVRKAGGKVFGVPSVRVPHLSDRIAIRDQNVAAFRELAKHDIPENGKS